MTSWFYMCLGSPTSLPLVCFHVSTMGPVTGSFFKSLSWLKTHGKIDDPTESRWLNHPFANTISQIGSSPIFGSGWKSKYLTCHHRIHFLEFPTRLVWQYDIRSQVGDPSWLTWRGDHQRNMVWRCKFQREMSLESSRLGDATSMTKRNSMK